MATTKDLPPRDKAQAGMWLIRQAILDLLKECPEGMRPSELRNALGLVSENDEAHGIATAFVKQMVDDGELVKGDGNHPRYTLPK